MIALILFIAAGVLHLIGAFGVASSVSWGGLANACIRFGFAAVVYGR